MLRAAPDKRLDQNTVTGMRDFSTAIQELDEMWCAIFNQGLIRPAARRQAGGIRVADVSLAEYDDEEAFLAASSDRPFCTFEQILSESNCWNCRGFGHVRTACPSSDSTRSIGYVIQALSSINERKSRGVGKGKGKAKGAQGCGGGGRGRSAAGRGSGAIAVYLEEMTNSGA